uniref:NAC domain-containing protein n=1 Tax=Oryza nivara TaxID=4536 RepID=A0A0E0IS18_ORYNI
MYAEDEENGYIYFFSTIEFKAAKPKQKKWPRRAAQGGRWKAVLGSSQMVEVGGVPVGRKLSMEFYVKGVRTNWGMHEFVRIIGPNIEVADLAVYRLHKLWTNGEEKPGDLAADVAKSTNQSGQASAADYYQTYQNAVSQAYAYAPPYVLQPGWSQGYPYDVAAAPPTAPWPVCWAPPSAPGSYDCCYASTFSRPPPPPPIAASTLDKAPITSTDHGASTNTSAATPAANNKPPPPPVAATATTLGKKGEGKGKAPTTTSTDHAGSTNTSAPPAANYQPPPLQGTQHVFASGVVIGHEDEEGYLVVDEVNTWRNTQQLVLEDDDDDDDGRAAGAGAGEGGASASGR